jgi:septum formation protein
MSKPLILASASLTRCRLLAAAGVEFQHEPAWLDEQVIKQDFRSRGRSAIDCALALAEAKAIAVAVRRPDALVIGADQILRCQGKWFDKPASLEDARSQLQLLRGLAHELVTTVCAVVDGGRVWSAANSATLTMRQFSDEFLDAYLDAEGTAVLGSVGAYHVEGRGIQLFSRIEGDYFLSWGFLLSSLSVSCVIIRFFLPDRVMSRL